MKESKDVCNLNNCFLCTNSVKDWLPAIGAHKTNFIVKKGESIFKEGDPVKGVYFVYTGKVKVHKRWNNDKELIIRFAKPGDILGHMGLGNNPVYPVATTALEQTTLCYIDLSFFESTLNVNHKFTYALMKFFADELQKSEKRMRNLVHMPVKERIALAMLNLKNLFGTDAAGAINIELTRQDLSSYAAVSYETWFKVTQDFIQDGLIAVNGKSIVLLNEPALQNLVDNANEGFE
ncbi:Crp/Fnr family transcriptional regulator [Mucilaginibacter sp. AK015]|uniref:Crp/Fnr family transcriptional regulator n=1 Tax=Mucilaginibacter sp. AK015 TaxID=2723072 RepID=UPI00161355AB|nr:Crp/Fnr family transcriptional regulator [Mucilaginibacter sp. AK015]MBB5394998.1 CRP/FNR family transcriptional regulator [Mucilaginibacter sp. AK015]